VHVDNTDPEPITVDAVVNCASLGAQDLARATEGYPPERVPSGCWRAATTSPAWAGPPSRA
jgi:L-2-hydroxyglutarate oxidase LhgO